MACNCNKGKNTGNVQPAKVVPKKNSPQASGQFSNGRLNRATLDEFSAPAAPQEFTGIENISGETFADKCRTFGYMLGLDEPVSERVLRAALENPTYANKLLLYRNPSALQQLLAHPPEVAPLRQNDFSNRQLLAKAGKALLKWGLSGFPTVAPATLEKRENACLACPNLVASGRTLQRITASSTIKTVVGNRTGNSSCAICGCVIKNKIRLATETCPQEVTETPGFNRWEERVQG